MRERLNAFWKSYSTRSKFVFSLFALSLCCNNLIVRRFTDNVNVTAAMQFVAVVMTAAAFYVLFTNKMVDR